MSSTNKTNYSYTKKEIDSMGGGSSLSDTISQKADKSDLSNYLPLSGGKLTGHQISQNTNAGHLEIIGGTDWNSGPSLVLTPNNSTEGWLPQGSFVLHAQNDCDLMGKPDGTLTWNGKQVATETDLNNYLPKSGGQMTGSMITRDKDNETLQFHAGLTWEHGAWIHLAGKDYERDFDGFGAFTLGAHNGTQDSRLMGKPDGTLTWNGKQVATETDLSNYLPLSGGAMTGFIFRNVDNDRLEIHGGTGWMHGAWIGLGGKDKTDSPGHFTIGANDGTNICGLTGTPSGSLTWGGKQVATESDLSNYFPKSGGQMTGGVIGRNVTNGQLSLRGSTKWDTGARLDLNGMDNGGDFNLIAYKPNVGAYGLAGKPTGELTWEGKSLDVIEEQGDGYIRYSNGIQICWGNVSLNDVSGISNMTISSFAKEYKSVPCITATYISGDGFGWSGFMLATDCTTTSVIFHQWSIAGGLETYGNRLNYFAIGRWK